MLKYPFVDEMFSPTRSFALISEVQGQNYQIIVYLRTINNDYLFITSVLN